VDNFRIFATVKFVADSSLCIYQVKNRFASLTKHPVVTAMLARLAKIALAPALLVPQNICIQSFQ
jgi:hypothetical protein